jgi:PAS domain S-box-containing protein
MVGDPHDATDHPSAAELGALACALALVRDGFAWMDTDGSIVWCNPAFATLVQADGASLVGTRISETLHLYRDGQSIPRDAHPARRVLAEQDDIEEVYEAIVGKRRRVVEVFGRRGRIGGTEGAVVVVHDITEAARAHSELKLVNTKLEASNSELEAFSYSVSHDLRTPLRAIDGFSQALLEDYGDVLQAEGKDYLRRLRAAAQNMGRLIDDMLRLSRITRAELEWQDVDLSEMCRAIVAELVANAPERRIEISIEAGMHARGDAHWLHQAMENLLGNAWKFTSKTGSPRIEVGATSDAESGERVFFVRDNGAGFANERAEKLFAPFQRLHGADEFPGTGVGLAIVRRIIHRHGGRIWADATIGKGATFYFTLPSDIASTP